MKRVKTAAAIVTALFITYLTLLILFELPKPAAAASECCYSSNDCMDNEECKWGDILCFTVGAGKCTDLPCTWYLYAGCTSDSICGKGMECKAGADCDTNYAKDHSCQKVCVNGCVACQSPNADCDENGGCETNTNTDGNNCGSCDNDCTAKSPYCSGGKSYSYPGPCDAGSCRVTDNGYTDSCCAAANPNAPNACSSGCKNTQTDWNNCGSCGNDCTAKSPYCAAQRQYSYPGQCSGGSCAVSGGACSTSCGSAPQCNGINPPGSCTTAGGIGGTCSSSCESCDAICTDSDSDGVKAEGAECGAADCAPNDGTKWQLLTGYADSDGDGYGAGSPQSVCSGNSLPSGYSASGTDCNDANSNIYPTSCSGAAISWPSTCATSTTGGCGSGTCTRITNGVECGSYDCDTSDTTCRNYDDIILTCSGGSCPDSASCTSYTDSPASTACYSATTTCAGGDNPFCSNGDIWAYTEADKSCTGYCTGTGTCNTCTPPGCDTALWSTCSDTCSGESTPSYTSQDVVTNYEPCQQGQTSCPATSLNDVCTGSQLTEYYCNGADPTGNTVDCNSFDGECQGVCGSSIDGCAGLDYSCSGGGNGYCSSSNIDADTGSSWCSGCGLNWVAGGEAAAFGEYAVGNSEACCGDDLGEHYRSTSQGASTYTACCDSATDCVDSGNVCVPEGSMSNNFKCVSGSWIDGDASEASCGVAGGWWSAGGEVAASACCGDDLGEFKRSRLCAAGVCISNLNDRACCDSDKDCVNNGECFYDVDSAISGIVSENEQFCSNKNQNSCTSGESKIKCAWTGTDCIAANSRAAVQFSQQSGGSYAAYADVNNDGKQEVCVASSPGQWEGSTGSLSGRVSNISVGDQCSQQCAAPCVQGCPVGSAVVRLSGSGIYAVTAPDGTYTISNTPTGAYDVTASASTYEAKSAYGMEVYDGGTTTADFILTKALGDCQDSCKKVGSRLCDASCQGKGLCWFYNDETWAACDGTFGIIEMPNGDYVECCKGKPFEPIKAQATVPSKHVVVKEEIRVYKGKLAILTYLVFTKK